MPNPWEQIAAEMTSLLRGHGFKRSGLRFTDVRDGGVVRQVSLLKFRWNVPGHQRFQIMLSLYLATGDQGEFTFGPSPRRYSLVFEKSSGYLRGDENFLYVVPPSLPDSSFLAQLRRDLTDDILPFLDCCTTTDMVIATLEQENQKVGRNIFSITLAVALARLGRIEESRLHFRKSVGDREAIRSLAGQYGISLDRSPV